MVTKFTLMQPLQQRIVALSTARGFLCGAMDNLQYQSRAVDTPLIATLINGHATVPMTIPSQDKNQRSFSNNDDPNNGHFENRPKAD